ncbi:MAG TPA: zinc ribbon domain-containing protein [Blastocatellia bacterium]|nr:zinc ribbon domain-containing protein [Blastocatellia bacterium]
MEKVRCQSCGMPLSAEFGNIGTNGDGSNNPEFCIFCYKDGSFTRPGQTLEEMIQSSVENMTADLNMPEERARELAGSVIPGLKRWRRDEPPSHARSISKDGDEYRQGHQV